MSIRRGHSRSARRPWGRVHSLWIWLTGSLVIAILLAILLRGGGRRQLAAEGQSLVVLAAAGLRAPMEAIATQYEREFGTSVDLQFGGSGTLLNQIQVNDFATSDLFVSADEYHAQKALSEGLATDAIPLAAQRIVLVVRKDDTRAIASLDDLLSLSVRISCGSPDQAAVGRVVRRILEGIPRGDSNCWQAFEQHVTRHGVFKPTVNDVANDVRLGAVDAGLVWDATVAAREYREALRTIDLPELQGATESVQVALLAKSQQPTQALRFARYMSARDRGLATFAEHGLRPVDGDQWAETPEITLFCGAVNRRPLENLLDQFQRREGVVIHTVYDGCGVLTARMAGIVDQRQAAGFPDAYMACDRHYLEPVQQWFQEDVDVSDTEIVLVVPKGRRSVGSLRDLIKPGIRVAIGRSDQCTIGVLTRRLLDSQNLYESLMRKQGEPGEVVVEKPSSSLLIPDVASGHVDAVIAYESDALPNLDRVDVIHLDSSFNRAVQPFSIARNSDHKQLMRRLLHYISQHAADFEKAGFHFRLQAPAKDLRPVSHPSTGAVTTRAGQP